MDDSAHISLEMHTWYAGRLVPAALEALKPRHPDAAGALLGHSTTLLSVFGGVTKGPLTAAGTHSMSNEQLGKLYSDRTGLDARTLKGLHEKARWLVRRSVCVGRTV